jgi:Lantibiotic dehydratase, N terminus
MFEPPIPFTLAPVGILRAAAWSLECLDGFGDRSLAEAALKAIEGGNWDIYESAYNRVFDRERAYLISVTVGDLRFRRAIRLSNSIVSAKIEGLDYTPGELPPRNKMLRRLEHTLYRYLARSIGRTNPNGLWAGVGLIEFGTEDTTSIDRTTAEHYFTIFRQTNRIPRSSLFASQSYLTIEIRWFLAFLGANNRR